MVKVEREDYLCIKAVETKQWHPAFCAAMELEFKDDREALLYEREHNLSKKPLQIDLLIIKRNKQKAEKRNWRFLFWPQYN